MNKYWLLVILLAVLACGAKAPTVLPTQTAAPTVTPEQLPTQAITQEATRIVEKTIIVTAGYCNIRSDVNGHGSVLAVAQTGDILTIIKTGSHFIYVQNDKGITGYISDECCNAEKPRQ